MIGRRRPYYRGSVSSHFDGTRFFVPGHSTDKRLGELLRWHWDATWRGGRAAWPASFPSPFAAAQPQPASDALRITLIGHASFLLQVGGLNILIDPVFSPRASPLSWAGPLRVNPPGIAWDNLPAIDCVLLTHNHYDHLDLATLQGLWQRFLPRVVAPLGNDAVIQRSNPDIAVEVLDWGEAAALSPTVTAHLEPALHWSARTLGDRRMALWGAFVLTTPAGVIYHVGDTAFGDGSLFAAIREKHGPPTLAILPIGAYEPRWFMGAQHMNPAEAVQAFRICGATAALGHHWGTFQLTDEAIEAPVAELASALSACGIEPERFRALRPGEVFIPA